MIFHTQPEFTLHHGDALDIVAEIPRDSIDSVVCDPPYELGFMGKKWDKSGVANNVQLWRLIWQAMKPGAHLLAFGGTRTYHRMVCAIEDAGFDIRDQIGWLYGSGFPKSLNLAKAMESGTGRPEDIRRMEMGEDYEPSGRGRVNYDHGSGSVMDGGRREVRLSDDARQWEGWGTALKPAWEPIVLARKPFPGTVAGNVKANGVGALNVNGCRVGTRERPKITDPKRTSNTYGKIDSPGGKLLPDARWPANVIHDGSPEVLAAFPDAVGAQGEVTGNEPSAAAAGTRCFGVMARTGNSVPRIEAEQSAARFFYCAKASKLDRDEGLQDFDRVHGSAVTGRKPGSRGAKISGYAGTGEAPRSNIHPTVKPTALMRYLCRLVTPPQGLILDWCNGSGSTGKAAVLEGFRYTGIDLTGDYLPIARARIAYAMEHREKWDYLHGPDCDQPAADVEGQVTFF